VLGSWRWWGGDEGEERDADGFDLCLSVTREINSRRGKRTLRKASILALICGSLLSTGRPG
jgi:hypothetical protein